MYSCFPRRHGEIEWQRVWVYSNGKADLFNYGFTSIFRVRKHTEIAISDASEVTNVYFSDLARSWDT